MSANPSHFSLRKRSWGVYHITYLVQGRRRWKSTGATTKPEALKALSDFQRLIEETPKTAFLSEFISDFQSYAAATFAPKTQEIYRHVLSRFSRMVGNPLLVEITPQHFDRYKAARLKATRTLKDGQEIQTSPTSVNIELRALRAAFKTACRWKLIPSAPFEDVTLAAVPERTPSYFSPKSFEQLVASIHERWLREVVLFAVLTGMRRGEILSLKWSQVNAERRVVTIESCPTFKTKAGKRRIIPLNETAVFLLESRRTLSPSEFVFTFKDGPIPEGWLSHKFKKYVQDLKLAEGLHFHSLRHTFASWLVQSGATLFEVQKLMGHSSSSVTEVYSHLQPEQMHNTVNRINVSLS
jgi:integrase